jgi:zinc D-Ala-D-Ala carboxypeptidase
MRALLTLLIALACAVPVHALGQRGLHPRFRISRSELAECVALLPAAVRERALAAPADFLTLMDCVLDEQPDLLLLVDKTRGLPTDYVPPDLVSLDRYPLELTRSGLSLRRVIMADLLAMAKAARAMGIILPLSSSYRSYDYQVKIYQQELMTKSREEVERELAPPGHSQHQLGTVIDFGSIDATFAETRAGKWLLANAAAYGFSLSYPPGSERETGYTHEPWHYRYVGKCAASLIEGFFGGSQQRFLEFLTEKRRFFTERRKA